MKFIGLIVITIVILFFVIPGPHARFGRDLIFYSGDVEQFLLPNGKTVNTNEWYEWGELLQEKQELFLQDCPDHEGGHRLGILEVEGLSLVIDDSQGVPTDHVDVNNNRTHLDEDSPSSSFQEFWVRIGSTQPSAVEGAN